MKKTGLLAAAMMAAVVIGGCQTAEEKPVYNFSTRFPNASEAYGVQYGGKNTLIGTSVRPQGVHAVPMLFCRKNRFSTV